MHVSKAEGDELLPTVAAESGCASARFTVLMAYQVYKQRRVKCRLQGAEAVVSHYQAKQHDGRLRSP